MWPFYTGFTVIEINYSYFSTKTYILGTQKNHLYKWVILSTQNKCLTLKAPIPTKVICFSRLLKCLRSLYGKQFGPRSDCSYRSSLFWVHTICFYTLFFGNVRQLFAADDFSRHPFQIDFFLGALRVKMMDIKISTILH